MYRREDDPARATHNDITFHACHEILDGGGAILIFPEGRSETDRRLADMKTSAARMALAQEERPGQAGRLTLLPAGLHFPDRTAFGSDVVLTFGEPIPLAEIARLTSDPAQVAQLRIVAGIVFFPLAYAALGLALRIGAGWPLREILAVLFLVAALGVFTLAYARWLARHLDGIRVAFLTLRRRQLIARLIAERRSLIRTFDAARAECRNATTSRVPVRGIAGR